MKILKDGYLYASSLTNIHGLYDDVPLDYVYFTLLGDYEPTLTGGVIFVFDIDVLFRRTFRYALSWTGNRLDETTKVNYRYDDVRNILDKINKRVIDTDDHLRTVSHEILLRKKINLRKYLIAICCKDMLSFEAIKYLKNNYPNVKILSHNNQIKGI